jgi:cytochrome c-type biogenesis protein
MNDIGLVFAFSAGLVSFLAPCVLPLVPGFLAYLAGINLDQAESNRKQIFLNSLFFVLGFSIVFAALGVLLNTLLEKFAYDVQIWLGRVGGAIIIFFGFYLTGLIKIGFLEREHKIQVKQRFNSRYLTSFVFGAAFAAGWTPCVGAVLGGILALAASQPGSAFSLLMSYALGFGTPFLVVGLFADKASHLLAKFARAARVINILFGVILILLGILIFTQNLSMIANFEILNSLLLR